MVRELSRTVFRSESKMKEWVGRGSDLNSERPREQAFHIRSLVKPAPLINGSSSAPGRPGFFETADRSEAGPIPNVSASRKGRCCHRHNRQQKELRAEA